MPNFIVIYIISVLVAALLLSIVARLDNEPMETWDSKNWKVYLACSMISPIGIIFSLWEIFKKLLPSLIKERKLGNNDD